MHRGGRVDRPHVTPSTLWIFVVVSVLSLAGTRLAAIAVPWYVLTSTGSPTLTGVVAFAELAPYVVVKALAGPFIDRLGPVRVALVGDAASAAAIACVPLLHGAGLLTYPTLIALVALIGVLRAPGDGAKTTLVPLVAIASGASLERVGGAYGAVDRLAATLGAAFGGLVIGLVGGANALWLTVAALVLDLVVLVFALGPRLSGHSLAASLAGPPVRLDARPTGADGRTSTEGDTATATASDAATRAEARFDAQVDARAGASAPPTPARDRPSEADSPGIVPEVLPAPGVPVTEGGNPPPRASYLTDLQAGWRFLRGDAVLVAIVVMLAFTNMLEQAFGVALVPMWAWLSGGGPRAIGYLFATSALFSAVGAVVAAGLGDRLARRPVYVIAYLLVGLPRFAILAVDAPMPVTIAVLAVGGFAAGFINPILGAVIVERIPGPLMGRVNTLAMACAWALLPFGGLLGGVLVSSLGLSPALWVVGVLYVVATLAPTLLPAWRQIDRRPGPPADSAERSRPDDSRRRAARPSYDDGGGARRGLTSTP